MRRRSSCRFLGIVPGRPAPARVAPPKLERGLALSIEQVGCQRRAPHLAMGVFGHICHGHASVLPRVASRGAPQNMCARELMASVAWTIPAC
jgi:hypothetical protein